MTSPHIIRRQYLEVEVIGTESDGFALHRRLPDLCRDWLNPALERVLERTVPANEHWLIDRLEIDAGSFRLDELERDLAGAVTEALERYFRERAGAGSASRTQTVASSTPITRRLEVQSLQEAFVYFLETGVLPWWFQLPVGKGLEECIREAWLAAAQPDGRPEQFARALGLVIGAASVRQRLVWQFSSGFLSALLASISETAARCVLDILELLGKQDIESQTLESFGEGVWETAFVLTLTGKRVTPEILLAESLLARSLGSTPTGSRAEHQDVVLLERITQLWPGVKSVDALKGADSRLEKRALDESDAADGGTALREPPRRNRERDRPASRVNLEEGVYVGCAGVVLLHPFLPRLFEALGIVKGDLMLKPERALSVLHFLATGRHVAPEYDLILPKLLCNLPLEAPAQSRIELTAAEEAEAIALLGAVIRHWDALGETSVEGLRGSFLVRPGKLSQRGGDDLLQVEAQSYDILLDRLPWSIGLIQLPWMQRMLWVEWRF